MFKNVIFKVMEVILIDVILSDFEQFVKHPDLLAYINHYLIRCVQNDFKYTLHKILMILIW